MDEKTFDAGSDPEDIAAKLGLAVVQWHDGVLYARDQETLYSIAPAGPADPRVRVNPEAAFSGYVGEEHHSPREAAVHAGLTVIEDGSGGNVTALDGFGRRYLVHATGNGPQAVHEGWATDDELKKFTPRHRPCKPTLT